MCEIKYIMSHIFEIIAVIGALLATWFVATDKNRNELFKTKLIIYQDINRQMAKVFSLSPLAVENKTKYLDSLIKERVKLFDMVFESSAFISNNAGEKIVSFLDIPISDRHSKRENQVTAFNQATHAISKDLNLDKLNIITQLSCAQYDELKMQLTNTAKEKKQT